MNNFRLYQARFDEKNFITNKIQLVDESHNTDDNYISLIIGNNGTGKSRVLSKIARYFLNEKKEVKQLSLFGTRFRYNRLPKKIIALTNSISDKFPVDESYRPPKQIEKDLIFRDFKYNYLGRGLTSNGTKTYAKDS